MFRRQQQEAGRSLSSQGMLASTQTHQSHLTSSQDHVAGQELTGAEDTTVNENSEEAELSRRLIWSSLRGDVESVKEVLDHPLKLDPNVAWPAGHEEAPFWTANRPGAALRAAAQHGREEIVELLLRRPTIQVDACDNEAIRSACA